MNIADNFNGPDISGCSREIISHGADIVDIDRIKAMRQRHGQHFLDRLFTPAEQQYCLAGASWPQHLAGRFAAKEAVLKSLGTGWRGGIAWCDIEILNDSLGAPIVTLDGMCKDVARKKRIDKILLSISHTKTLAFASAIAVG